MKCMNHPDVDAVAKCISCGSSICDDCRVVLKSENYCKKCIVQKAEGASKQERSPGLAALLSLIIGGAGQIYNGQIGKGLLILFTSWLILPWIYGVYDAYSTAKKINEGKITPKTPAGCGIAVIVASAMLFFFIFFIGLLAAIAIPNFIMARQTAIASACKANLKMIEGAKQVWALDVNASNDAIPTWEDLVPNYMTKKPECAAGGSYPLESVGEPAICSIGDNKTSTTSDDHVI